GDNPTGAVPTVKQQVRDFCGKLRRQIRMIGSGHFLTIDAVLSGDVVHSLTSSSTQMALGIGEQLKFHTVSFDDIDQKTKPPGKAVLHGKTCFVTLRCRWLSQYPTQWPARTLAGHGRNVQNAQRAGHRHVSFDRPSSSRLASSRQLR